MTYCAGLNVLALLYCHMVFVSALMPLVLLFYEHWTTDGHELASFMMVAEANWHSGCCVHCRLKASSHQCQCEDTAARHSFVLLEPNHRLCEVTD